MSLTNLSTLDADLAAAEANVARLKPQCAKHVVWGGAKGRKTKIAFVYVHGFSATHKELRPVPDQLAKAFDANIFYARLTGHGQSGEDLGKAKVGDWIADTQEAIRIGHMLGERVILMGCSTGCPLIHKVIADGARCDGLIYVSPNFGLANPLLRSAINLPAARKWGPQVLGKVRAFEPESEEHSIYWTLRYPVDAVFTMQDAVQLALGVDHKSIDYPTLMWFSDQDQVVNAKKTREIASAMGRNVTLHNPVLRSTDHKMKHLIMGDVFSASQTKDASLGMIHWVEGL